MLADSKARGNASILSIEQSPPESRLPTGACIAVDTEFEGPLTLTVQAAIRLDPHTLVVQLYHNPVIPAPPTGLDLGQYLPTDSDHYGRFGNKVLFRPAQKLAPDLSPARMLQDLLNRLDLLIHTRQNGCRHPYIFDTPDPWPEPVFTNVPRRRPTGPYRVPPLTLTLVNHFQRADFARMFGSDFITELKQNDADAGVVRLAARKRLQYVGGGPGQHGPNPALQYIQVGSCLYALQIETADTNLPFGPNSLDNLSRAFLGLGKCGGLTEEDKRKMQETFHTRTADAYGYAAVDAINTLLVYEQMAKKDREIYEAFGFATAQVKRMRGTLGSRVSYFLMATTRQAAKAETSPSLNGRGLENLMRFGGVALLEQRPDASKFGPQTFTVHGGLLFSRSPTRFWHESPGMLRDVDLAGCYNQVISGLNVYWGRPVIFEPGRRKLTLQEAVDFASSQADPDAWLIRVSGPLSGYPNALIPSTEEAITSHNYKTKLRRGKRRAARSPESRSWDENGPSRPGRRQWHDRYRDGSRSGGWRSDGPGRPDAADAR